jgi:p-hydroxybenzoate 3-monooxygenase
LSFGGVRHRIDFNALTGRGVTVYGQTEVTRDLMDALAEEGVPPLYEAEVLDIVLEDAGAAIRFRHQGGERTLLCEYVAGCDGYHGIARKTVPAAALRAYERTYPFGWLGVLSETPPVSDELIYASHERGFALCSMRSPSLSRFYIRFPASRMSNNGLMRTSGPNSAGAWIRLRRMHW